MRFVTSTAHEFLVLGRRGQLRNLGCAARVLLRPGDTCVRVPGTKQEACFAMTQESQDGIPLRFKGIVLYRVVDPVAAASAFDFSDGAGHERIQALIEHVCLGELRDVVSHATLEACMEGRRTTLTTAVAEGLHRVVAGGDGAEGGRGWGLALDVVQVSQVYIVDDDLRRRLETELRNDVVARAEQSNLAMHEDLERARLASRKRLTDEALDQERAANALERERIQLQRALDADRVESEAATQAARLRADDAPERLALALRGERLPQAFEVQKQAAELEALQVETDLLRERGRAEIESAMLPLRQVPEIAASLASMFQGADLAIYGDDHGLLEAVRPVVDLVAARLRAAPTREGR